MYTPEYMISGTGTTFVFIFLRAAKFKLAAVCSMQEGNLAHNVSRVTSFYSCTCNKLHAQLIVHVLFSAIFFLFRFLYSAKCITLSALATKSHKRN